MADLGNSVHRNNDETAESHLALLYHYLSSQEVPLGNVRICLCRGRAKPQMPCGNHTPGLSAVWADRSDSAGPGLGDYLEDLVVLCLRS